MIPLLTKDETNAIHAAMLITIRVLESGLLFTEDKELLGNLKSALKKIRGENE